AEDPRNACVNQPAYPHVGPRQPDHGDRVLVDEQAVLEAEGLPPDGDIVVEARAVIPVEFGENLADVALEEERVDAVVEFLLEIVLRLAAYRKAVGVEGVARKAAMLVERAEADEEALGRRQVEVAEEVEPVGGLGHLDISDPAVEPLRGGA